MVWYKYLLLLLLLLGLTACGGGSGSSGGAANNGSSVPAASVTAERSAITVMAQLSDSTTERVKLTFNNLPADGLFVGIDVEDDTSINYYDLIETSANTADVVIEFASGDSLAAGTYNNRVTALFCLDATCRTQINGSPVSIDTTLVVEYPTGSISASQTSVSVSSSLSDDVEPDPVALNIDVEGVSRDELYLYIEQDPNGNDNIGYMDHDWVSSSRLNLQANFFAAYNLGLGSHSTSYEVSLCFDGGCERHLEGSPITIDVNYTVSRLPVGVEVFNPDSRTEIQHDIVDAEYSKVMNAIAVAASSPDNAVYVYQLDTGVVSKLPLNLPATSISFANAGNSSKIAVGHNGKITWIDFNAANPSLSSSKVLNTTIDVFDLAATEEAVYAVPRQDQWTELHRIDVSDNSMTASGDFSIYAGARVKMHPDLQSVYLADNGISPSDIEKIDISGASPVYVTDSPYHGEHAMCGNLWMSDDGKRIYTACGNTFNASHLTATDMTYSGQIPLKRIDDYWTYPILSVAESPVDNEITLIQKDGGYLCDDIATITEGCIHYISFFSKDYLNSLEDYAFDTVTVSGNQYAEQPLHVFYHEDGRSVYVLTKLVGIPTDKAYLLRLDR